MIEFILFLILMGLLDSLNPFSIGLQIVLLPILKNKHHILWYIIGVFVTYFFGGILIFTGLDVLLANLFSNINFSLMPYPLIELILGILLLSYTFITIFKRNDNKDSKKAFSIHPGALFFLGATGTIFDLPTAIPYLAILGRATVMKFTILQLLPFLILYCIIYLLPMIAIQITYLLFHEKILPSLNKIKMWFDKINKLLMVIFSLLISLFLILDSIFALVGKPLW